MEHIFIYLFFKLNSFQKVLYLSERVKPYLPIFSSSSLRSSRPSFIISSSQHHPWQRHSRVDPWLRWWFATEISYKVKSQERFWEWCPLIKKDSSWHRLLVDRYHWDQSVSFMYVDVVPPDEATFTVTGLHPATTYSFSINALNAIGESGYADNNAVLTITTKGQFGVTLAPGWEDWKVPASNCP